jgi:hypothetical protein
VANWLVIDEVPDLICLQESVRRFDAPSAHFSPAGSNGTQRLRTEGT